MSKDYTSSTTRRNINGFAKQEYENERETAKAYKKVNKETLKQQAKLINADIDKINRIIKEKGYYDGPDGEHFEKRQKHITYKQLLQQEQRKLVKPHKPIGKISLFVRLKFRLAKLKEKIANFFVNLGNRRNIYSQESIGASFAPDPTAGLGTNRSEENVNDPLSQQTSQEKSKTGPAQEEQNSISQMFPLRRNIDINKEYQDWLTENQINNVPPSELVFDYMKSTVEEGYMTDEQSVSDILSYALESPCEYNAEDNSIMMFFAVKDSEGVAAFSINENGEISFPEKFVFRGEELENAASEEIVKKMPNKVEMMVKALKENPELLNKLTTEHDYSKTDLTQVREFVEKGMPNLTETQAEKYEEAIQAVENAFPDKNTKQILNKLIVDATKMNYFASPEVIFDIAFIRPAKMIKETGCPEAAKTLFPVVLDKMIKGYSADDAFDLAKNLVSETYYLTSPTPTRATQVRPPEQINAILSHIEGLEKQGIGASDIINITSKYRDCVDTESLAIQMGIVGYELANGTSIKKIGNSLSSISIDPQSIASTIICDMADYTPEEIKEQITNANFKTMSSVYINALSEEHLKEVAEELPASIRGEFEKISGLQHDLGDYVLDDASNSDNWTHADSFDKEPLPDNSATIESDTVDNDLETR